MTTVSAIPETCPSGEDSCFSHSADLRGRWPLRCSSYPGALREARSGERPRRDRVVWQPWLMSLEIADKLASVASALLGTAGLLCTLIGLALQWKSRTPRPSSRESDDEPSKPRLEVPPRSEWVPNPTYLPPPAPQWGGRRIGGAGGGSDPGSGRKLLPTGARVLRIGLVMLALSLVGIAVALAL
jgi:hypothetical protein